MQDVGFNREIDVIEGQVVIRLPHFVTCPMIHLAQRDKGLVTDNTGQSQSFVRVGSLVVVASLEMGVPFNGVNLLEVVNPLQDGGSHTGGDRDDQAYPLGMPGGQAETLHAGQAGTNHGVQAADFKVVQEMNLRVDDISHADVGECCRVGYPCGGIDRGRSRRTITSAEIVGADDEKLVGIQCFSRSDEAVPPAGFAFLRPQVAYTGYRRIDACGMLTSAEGVEEKDGVALIGVQLAIGFIGERDRGKGLATSQAERIRFVGEGEELCFDVHRLSWHRTRLSRYGLQSLVDVGKDIIDVFDADGEAHEFGADPSGGLCLFGELRVGRGRRVNGQALRIADVGEVRKEFQVLDKLASSFFAALDPKDDHGASTMLEVFLGQGVTWVVFEPGIAHPLHAVDGSEDVWPQPAHYRSDAAYVAARSRCPAETSRHCLERCKHPSCVRG